MISAIALRRRARTYVRTLSYASISALRIHAGSFRAIKGRMSVNAPMREDQREEAEDAGFHQEENIWRDRRGNAFPGGEEGTGGREEASEQESYVREGIGERERERRDEENHDAHTVENDEIRKRGYEVGRKREMGKCTRRCKSMGRGLRAKRGEKARRR